MRKLLTVLWFSLMQTVVLANEYHVSKSGNDTNDGSRSRPFKTIMAAAQKAYAGDTITVHKGVYREWINPPRGGDSDTKRILYRAAPNEKVEIKGSEIITDWKKLRGGVWNVVLPNSFFKDYNPFLEVIEGDWFMDKGRIHHTGDVFLEGRSLFEVDSLAKVHNPIIDEGAKNREQQKYTWYTEVSDKTTTIWANFQRVDPNKKHVEISTRKTCFYPSKQGIDYITIKGFHFSQAATQWAAPTAEQIGMIATHWNKGWVIEDNIISDSRCVGITLGKERGTGHNVWTKDEGNINRDGNIHYIEVIFNVMRNKWNKENIGSHIVRKNKIYNCEQAGIAGSMGAIYSRIEDNHIYNINVKNQFEGWEIAGIKFHAPVDVVIKGNRIHDAVRGIWLDWMTQGARVTENLMYRNYDKDLFVEVNHGPFLVDNNILLSKNALHNWSQGGAYVHNLFLGHILTTPELKRFTPYFLPHSTEMAGLSVILGGDDQFYNNVFAWRNRPEAIIKYDSTKYKSHFDGNTYLNGIKTPKSEKNGNELSELKTDFKIIETDGEVKLRFINFQYPAEKKTKLYTTDNFSKTKLSKCNFEHTDGSTIQFNEDFFGTKRVTPNVSAGPFADPAIDENGTLVVWKK
ncbi:right-handed parallel beta-helix repeat-containing protein [Maribacter sp. 2210JD10-5]|uniref:right-handed parallel beta-helix repeat-containing protein n=1 Tax=Maribacter sp. 2210JD10-5 TaxID=3386272 RepID=UPI0039BC70FC